jgi:hypothetical protein
MASSVVRLLSLLLVALSLGLSLARLLELPNKINLCVEDYFTVQSIYRGWALLGLSCSASSFYAACNDTLARQIPEPLRA